MEGMLAGTLGRSIVLAAVVGIVLLNTIADGLVGYFLLMDDLDKYRAWHVVSLGLTGVINIVLVVVAWVLFDAMGRIERESDRVQMFMDNIYKRGIR